MFELTLSTTLDKQKYLGQFFSKLSKEIKQDGGVVISQNTNGRTYVAIAVEDDKKEYYKAKILDYILFVIVDDYKYNFFKEKIVPAEPSVVFESFLKAISIFDAENDKEIIKSQIQFSGEILIDSFFHFKLQLLRARWDRTANIISQNGIMQNPSSMLDILKYLVAVSDYGIVLANISLCKKQIILKTYETEKRFKNNFEGLSGFYAEIVRLNPSKINIKQVYEQSVYQKTTDTLSHIFGEKIYFANWI